MSWVVDTSILIDIAIADPKFGISSGRLLEERLKNGLLISPFTFVELSPLFKGNLNELRNFLRFAGIEYDLPFIVEDQEVAAKIFAKYISEKRQGRISKRPIADILIGAFASRFQGLITRNVKDFKRLFPKLKIIEP